MIYWLALLLSLALAFPGEARPTPTCHTVLAGEDLAIELAIPTDVLAAHFPPQDGYTEEWEMTASAREAGGTERTVVEMRSSEPRTGRWINAYLLYRPGARGEKWEVLSHRATLEPGRTHLVWKSDRRNVILISRKLFHSGSVDYSRPRSWTEALSAETGDRLDLVRHALDSEPRVRFGSLGMQGLDIDDVVWSADGIFYARMTNQGFTLYSFGTRFGSEEIRAFSFTEIAAAKYWDLLSEPYDVFVQELSRQLEVRIALR